LYRRIPLEFYESVNYIVILKVTLAISSLSRTL
jgi:hypothetical protein